MFCIIAAALVALYLVVDRLIRLPKVGGAHSKYVFITGCDSGFGRELTIRLDKMGYPVIAACFTQDGRSSLSEICSSRLVTLPLNVTDNESIKQAYQIVKEVLPNEKSLWAVVNNAGVAGPVGSVEFNTPKDYAFVCGVNLFGPIEVSRVFMPLLRKSRGRLVLMTSVMGRCPAATAPYCVSKYGLEGYGDVIRRDVSRFGVKVSMIEPGYFQTSIIVVDKMIKELKESYSTADSDVREAYGADYIEVFSSMTRVAQEFCSPDTYKVVDAYVEAITSSYPRPRYVVGNDAKFLFIPLSYMPEWIADVFLKMQGKALKKKRASTPSS